MKAAFVHRAQTFSLQEVADPVPGPDDVILRVQAAGICGSDLHFHRTTARNDLPRFAGGHEISGVVTATGQEVTDIPIGMRVSVEPLCGCGTCTFCSVGASHLCVKLRHLAVGFAEYAQVPQGCVHPLPEALSFEQGAMLDGIAVSLHALHLRPPGVSDTAIVLGDGTIALLLIQLLKHAGLQRIGVIGHHPSALQLAERFGVDETFHAQTEQITSWGTEFTGGSGADIVYECVGGNGSSFRSAQALVRPGGTMIVLGSFPPPTSLNLKDLLRREIALQFCYSYSTWNACSEFQQACELLQRGDLLVEPLISHRFPLSRIQDAFHTALQKEVTHAIKVMLLPHPE